MTLIPIYNVGYLWKCESTWRDDPQDIEIGYLEGTYTNDPGLLAHFIIFGYLKPWVLTIPPYLIAHAWMDDLYISEIKQPLKQLKNLQKVSCLKFEIFLIFT